MSVIEEINQYIDEALAAKGAFYLATVDGDKPAMRPLGFKMLVDGKLYIGGGTFKQMVQQMLANPNVQIVAHKGGDWLRIAAHAVPADDPALVEKCWEAMPDLKPLYEANGWTMGLFSIEDGTATYIENAMQVVRTEQF